MTSSHVATRLEAGAGKNAKDSKDIFGNTALMKASQDGHESRVRALLEAGADKDAKNNDGRTALMFASENGHESCVRALLEAGADKDAIVHMADTVILCAFVVFQHQQVFDFQVPNWVIQRSGTITHTTL